MRRNHTKRPFPELHYKQSGFFSILYAFLQDETGHTFGGTLRKKKHQKTFFYAQSELSS